MTRGVVKVFLALAALLVLMPAVAFAQEGQIAGTVRDPQGAVMPGVTVEVTSPALIEKVRTATTDSNGQYRITNLPVGTYKVTFTPVRVCQTGARQRPPDQRLYRPRQRDDERRAADRDGGGLRRRARRRRAERARGDQPAGR